MTGQAGHRLAPCCPPGPQGRIITREPQCQRDRQCPYPAFHNIIPSELCNSRRDRHLPLGGHQLLMGQKPAKTACRASDYTIRIMLRTLRRQGAKVLPSNSRVRRRQERAWRQWPACTRPFASPAPGRGIGAPRPPNSSTSVPLRISGVNIQATSPASTSVQCKYPAALCSEAAGRPVIKGQQSGQARQLAFDAVPPR